MEKLIIGIELCDNHIQVAVLGREEVWTFPTVICRKKTTEEWWIGEDAYKYTLVGDGVIVDQLLTLALKDGTSTIGTIKYEGMYLLRKYLQKILDRIRFEYPGVPVVQLVFSLKEMEMKLMDELMGCAEYLDISRSNVHIASNTECFVYYVLSQRRDVWGSQVGLFSLDNEDLQYYELKVSQDARQMTIWAEHEELEESFRLDVLDTPQ